MPRSSTCLLPVVLLLALPAAAGSPPPMAVATVDVDGTHTLVAWTMGAAADAYRVYGVAPGGGASLLAEVPPDTLAVVVPSGFASYGVETVIDGEAGGMAYASTSACVQVEQTPPSVGVRLIPCILELVDDVTPP